MLNKNTILKLLIFLLVSSTAYAQLNLREGEQFLEDKKVEFGKITCKVTPIVTYRSEGLGSLEIRFKAKWYKKNDPFNDPSNLLFLYDNYEKYQKYFENNGLSYEYSQDVTIAIKRDNAKSIQVLLNNKKIPYKPFKSGYIAFNSQTDSPIIIENLTGNLSLVELRFRFVYVTVEGKKRVFRDISREPASWKFRLPQSKGGQPDCEDLKQQYVKKIADLSELHDPEKAQDIRSEISNNPSFVNCPEVKKNLIAQIEEYINTEEAAGQNTEIVPEHKDIVIKEDNGDIESDLKKKTIKHLPAETKKIDWGKVEEKYNNVLNGLRNDYSQLDNKIKSEITALESGVEKNRRNIDTLANKVQLKNIGLDTIQLLKIRFQKFKSINSNNGDEIEKVINDIRNFSLKLKSQSNSCKKDFINLDKKQGLDKYKYFQERFEKLADQVNTLDNRAEKIQQNIGTNSDKLLNIFEHFDKEKVLIIRNIKAKYDSLFKSLLGQLQSLETRYRELKQSFEDMRFSRWYYTSRKNRYLNRAGSIYDQILELESKDSTAVAQKEKEFETYGFETVFDSKQDFDKELTNIKPGVEYLITDIKQWPAHSFPYLYLILIIIMASILIFGGKVYFKALRARKIKIRASKPGVKTVKNNDKPSSGGITITQTQNSQSKGKNLSEVRKKAGTDFLELDLQEEWDDTMVKKLYWERECIKKSYRFFEDSIRAVDTGTTANETGGYLIGRWDTNPDDPEKFDVSLEDFIEPGDDASFSRYQLNFGAKIGIKLQKILENRKQKDGKELVMTAWFHSHPGLKIFLSDFDLTVQNDFSGLDKKKRILALVIDPYTEKWDTGIFTYKSKGTMNNSGDSKKFYSLDEMYQWAIKSRDHEISQTPAPSRIIPDQFYSLPVKNQHPQSKVNKLYFSNPCILDIKRVIEDSNYSSEGDPILGYLSGTKHPDAAKNIDIVFHQSAQTSQDVSKESDDTGQQLGYIIGIKDGKSNIADVVSKIDIKNENILVMLAYNFEENTFLALTRDQKGSFNVTGKPVEKIDMANMVAWTRKRK